MTAYEAVLIRGIDTWPPLEPLHDAREMRWYHLTVIAASLFAIGVAVGNVVAG